MSGQQSPVAAYNQNTKTEEDYEVMGSGKLGESVPVANRRKKNNNIAVERLQKSQQELHTAVATSP